MKKAIVCAIIVNPSTLTSVQYLFGKAKGKILVRDVQLQQYLSILAICWSLLPPLVKETLEENTFLGSGWSDTSKESKTKDRKNA